MKKLTFISLFILAITSCKKDKFAPPEIQTLSVTANSPSSVSFVGNIISKGNQTIKDYGFVYSVVSNNLDENNGTKVSLGSSPQKGEFSKTVDNISSNSPYYSNMIWARAYVTDEKGTVFGSTISATLPRPSSSNIVPSSGKSGDVVRFFGKFYNPKANDVVINFQGVSAKVINASDGEISVEVPSGINAGHGQSVSVILSVGGTTVNSSMYFTMQANVKDFMPKSGIVGSNISLVGDNLPNGYSSNGISLYFGNVFVNNIYYTNQVMVPFTVGATSQISVVVGGQQKTLPGEFTVIVPQITSVTPEIALPGQTLTINGTNFPTQYDSSIGRHMVKLGSGTYQNVSPSYSNSLTYTIPTSTSDGEYTLYFKVGPHEVQAPKKIKVLEFSASSFSPTIGGVGREVNITGNFLQGANYNVAFGTANYYGTATSSTNLRVFVPTGVNAGKVKLTVDFVSKKVTLPGEFEIIGPSFTSFTPTSGVAGTLITIKGSGFNPSTYSTLVKFGTISVTPTSVTDNTIVVAVPSNVNPGAMKLSVVTNGQTVVHPDNFTITN